jgi:lipopolysaccharide/colanic/teichoic acid biosynthesis glycosyltransferase
MSNISIETINKEVYKFIKKNSPIELDISNVYYSKNINELIKSDITYNSINFFSRVNDIRYINKFFTSINEKLNENGIFVGCMETFQARKQRKKMINKIPFFRSIYFFSEFICLRVFPKVWGLKKIYFFVTRGRNRVLSKAEVLGRLISCGFEIIEFENFDGLLYFIVKKVKEPVKPIVKPSYGPLYKMPRIGKNGKIIGVYKFRTMHPYAEFLHDYILKKHGYSESGKPANDFRLTPWGKFFRRYWIDELPQLLNVLKGELKLVGVRPISQRYFNDIPFEIQQLRIKHKPGCIPPYVAYNVASSVESVLKAEKEYLIAKEKNPYFTDIICFIKAIWNILVLRKRSA